MILIEKIKLNNLVYGSGIVENFKSNSLLFYEKYSKSDEEVTNIPIGKIQIGGFYFFHYKDDSNWMKYSPIFTIDFKKFNNLIIINAINFNFIPLEVRATIFDKFITEKDLDENKLLNISYEGVYRELLKYGFPYAIVEYNLSQLVSVHKISMSLVPRFLYSQHPINKYDPKKLYEIWAAKIGTMAERDQEISKSLISDFYKVSDDIMENYNVLKGHIERIQKSFNKYNK